MHYDISMLFKSTDRVGSLASQLFHAGVINGNMRHEISCINFKIRILFISTPNLISYKFLFILFGIILHTNN